MVKTLLELAQRIAAQINFEEPSKSNVPSYDFAVDFDKENPERPNASGWYGIRKIDTGFDSNMCTLAIDYYGGGCPSFVTIWDGEEEACVVAEITKALINTLSFEGSAHAMTEVFVDTKETDYRFEWEQKKDDTVIGYYNVCLKDRLGNVVPGSEVSVWDYTVPWQRKNRLSRGVNDPETFCWSRCSFGASSSKTYRKSDNKTFEDIKAEVEEVIKNVYRNICKQAANTLEEYKPVSEWAERN